jgi:hypothetical protein
MPRAQATTKVRAILAGGPLLALALTGCSASSGGPSDKTDGGPTGCVPVPATSGGSAGTFSWKDNGTPQCATFILTGRQTGTAVDQFEVDTATARAAINMMLRTLSGPLGGTYSCQAADGGANSDVSLQVTGVASPGITAASSCTITIGFTADSTGMQHAQGTFSATAIGNGGTDVITDGMFDVTVEMQGG